MRRSWCVYLIVALIIGLISVLTYRNEKAYQVDCTHEQIFHAQRDSAIGQIVMSVDAIKKSMVQIAEHVEEVKEKIDTIRTIQEEQSNNERKQVRELQQVRRAINKCRNKNEK